MSSSRRSPIALSPGFTPGDYNTNLVTAGLGMLEIWARQLNDWRSHEPPDVLPFCQPGVPFNTPILLLAATSSIPTTWAVQQQLQLDSLSTMREHMFSKTLHLVWNMFSLCVSMDVLGWLLSVLLIISNSPSRGATLSSPPPSSLSLGSSSPLVYSSTPFKNKVLWFGHCAWTCPLP